MNGDPNDARDDVLGALALLEATICDMDDSPDKLRLAFASSALRRANEKLRVLPDNVIEFPHPGHSVKAGER